jgi:uncharacterized protein (DUF58 family)
VAGARTTLALGALLLLAGVGLAAPSLLLPGAALILAGLALAGWVELARRGVEVSRSGVPARIGEGEGFDVSYEVGAGRLPLLGELVDPLLGEPVPLRPIRPRGRAELRHAGTLNRRGRHLLPAPAIRIGDPLGLATRLVGGGRETPVLVLPRIEPVRFAPGDGPSSGRRRAAAGELADEGMRESAADPELEGLRPYRPGTRASRIYWPALARGDELLERHLSPAADSGPLVVLDSREASDRDALDRAVRAAASLVAHLGARGGCELMVGGDHRRRRVGGDPDSLLDARSALALVESTDGAPRPGRLAFASTVVWVSAGASRPPLARRSQGILITPHERPGGDPLLTVAGCFGYPLPGTRLETSGAEAAA